MPMTLSDFRNEVRDSVHRTAGAFSNTRLDRRINWAQEEIGGLFTFREMKRLFTRSTVDGQKRYDYPCRIKEVVSLVVVDGASSSKLEYTKAREFDRNIPYPESESETRPTRWVDYGSNFELNPIPDDEYVLKMRAAIFPAELSSDSSESELLLKDSLIVAFAVKLCYYALREIEDAEYWASGECKRLLASAVQADKFDADWTPVARPFTFRVSDYRDPESPFS